MSSISCSKINVHEISILESKHSGDLDKIREIYTLLRDYYNLYKKQNRSDKEISKLLWGKIKGIVYTKNIKFLKDAYKTITRLQYLRTHDRNIDKDTLNMILPMIESNKKYIERIIKLFDDIVKNKNIDKLIYEIELETLGKQ